MKFLQALGFHNDGCLRHQLVIGIYTRMEVMPEDGCPPCALGCCVIDGFRHFGVSKADVTMEETAYWQDQYLVVSHLCYGRYLPGD